MKQHKQLIALLLAVFMLVTLAPGMGTASAQGTDPSAYPIAPEELGSGAVRWSEETTEDGWVKVTNEDGVTLGYSPKSGVQLIQVDGYAFKDLNRNGALDLYEDWRENGEDRAADLAKQMTVEQVAGLMLYSDHQRSPAKEVNDDQMAFLDMGIRFVLSAAATSPNDLQAAWANAMQAYAEGIGLGIPVSISTDPRTVGVSVWPSNLAQAATFDPEIAFEAANELAIEYRALGITTLLGPQIDIATDPRWRRTNGTFGEDPALSRDMTQKAVSASQSTYAADGTDLGWGDQSVIAMIKHWPGDGPGESGRESHNFWGKYCVYPNNNFNAHLIPFVDGGLTVTDSITGGAASVMTSYSIAWSEDEEYGELVGSGFSEYKVNLLRSYGFDGIVCTDWRVLKEVDDGGRPWGVEDLTMAERFYMGLVAGIDQLGGWNDPTPVIEAYDIAVDEMGEEAALARYQDSGRRLTKAFFLTGLFDNPYVSVANAKAVVGNAEAVAAGLDAQQKSIVMLKNDGVLSAANAEAEKPTVYIPMVYAMGAATLPVDLKVAEQYFNVITDTLADPLTGEPDADGKPTANYEDIIRPTAEELKDCDYALVIITSPDVGGSAGGYDKEEEIYIPIPLQWAPYTADGEAVREESIAGDIVVERFADEYGVNIVETKENRSYLGESATVRNTKHLDTVLETVALMPESAKVVVAVNAVNPFVPAEFEPSVDALLVGFSVDNSLFMQALAGQYEPTGLLPLQMPADMNAVEAQLEDTPRDMTCYVDAAGNSYDFGFGLNWSGVIQDARTEKYCVPVLTEPVTQPLG